MNIGCARSERQKRKTIISVLFLLLLVFALLSGCTSTSDIESTAVNTGEKTATSTPILPTATATTEPTLAATPFVSLHEGEGLPDDLAVLSARNVGGLEEIGRWGNGVAYDLAWSPDGSLIAISTSRYLLLIDVETMEVTARVVTGFPLYRIAFSPDSRVIYGGGTQGKLLRFDITDEGQETINVGNILPVTAIAVSHNGQYVVIADWQRSVHLWDIEKNLLHKNFAETLSGSKALGFSGNDEMVFGWSPLEPIKGWYMLTAQPPEEYYFGLDANQRTGSSVRISADGTAAAVNQTWQLRVQNLNNGTTLGVLKDFLYEVEDLDIRADGEWTLSLHSDMVRLWQSSKSKLIADYDLADLADQNPEIIRISPDGSRFVLLGQDLIFFNIDADTQEITQTDIMQVNLATDLRFAALLHSDDMLYQMGLDGIFSTTALQGGDVVQNVVPTDNNISAYAVSGPLVAVGYENYTIEIRDAENLALDKTLRGLSKMPAALLLSEAQNVILAQTGKDSTGTWEISTGNYLGKQEWDIALDDLRLSADMRYVWGSGEGVSQRYDLETQSMSEVLDGRLLAVTPNSILMQRYGIEPELMLLDAQTFDPIAYLNWYAADSAVFSADGKLLAMSGDELIILDVEQAQVVLQIENPARGAELFFSYDGRLLFFVYADGTILLYGVPD
jgi:WD40 repeat protein